MTAALDLHPDAHHPVFAGVAEMHLVLDRLHGRPPVPLDSDDHARLVAELDRATRRITALKLKMVAAADKAGAPADAGYAGTEAWFAKHTTASRTTAAREVALAKDLDSGHDV